MRSLLFFKYRFTCKTWVAILASFAIAFFLSLGRWQLHRAHEKKTILDHRASFSNRAPTLWRPHLPLPELFEPLQLTGRFSSETFLLDNQYHNHVIGYQVITPFYIDADSAILIDRGWIPIGSSRKNLPKLEALPLDSLQIEGYTYYPGTNPLIFGPDVDYKTNHLTRIERLNLPFLSNFLHIRLYPFIIRLDKESPHGYLREWNIVSLPPERHYGYALQWFAMALVVGILFFSLNLKKNEPHCER